MEDNKPLVITAKQICSLLNISYGTFWRLCKHGVFTNLKYMNRKKMYPYQQLLDYVQNLDTKKAK